VPWPSVAPQQPVRLASTWCHVTIWSHVNPMQHVSVNIVTQLDLKMVEFRKKVLIQFICQILIKKVKIEEKNLCRGTARLPGEPQTPETTICSFPKSPVAASVSATAPRSRSSRPASSCRSGASAVGALLFLVVGVEWRSTSGTRADFLF
jgi:hypothetical protein